MGTAIALGNFDGVHKAHAALVRNMTLHARRHGLRAVVYIFTPHPGVLLRPDGAPFLIMTDEMKIKRLLELGVDRVQTETRGRDILSLSPKQFVKQILKEELGARFITAGFNYRFGKGAEGDAALLKTLCEREGIQCEIMDSVSDVGGPISSTRLRALLSEGLVEEANAISFAPYAVEGVIQEGKKLGRTLGFPTINVEMPRNLLLPKKGVYISRVKLGGRTFRAVTNIGQNPTVEDAAPRAESHLLDFSDTVYGENAEITLLKFLRGEQKFSDVDALSAQIRKDTEETRLYFERMNQYEADRT